MTSLSRRTRILAGAVPLAGLLAGCTATADLSYSEYRFRPGFQEQVYESRVYGDTSRGFGSEVCRTETRRDVNRLGEVIVRDVQICDGAPDEADGF
ncbi:MAG TPA: hypothetical protein VEZ16_19000 [Microvirga sp.]|nr:hypothetical protein [Microvirga sp.]